MDGGLYIYFAQYITNDFGASSGGGLAALKQNAYYVQLFSQTDESDDSINAAILPCSPFVCDDFVPGWQNIVYSNSTSPDPPFPSMFGNFRGNSTA